MTYAGKHKLVIEAMEQMGYSAMNLGQNDVSTLYDFVEDTSRITALPLISANAEERNGTSKNIKKYVIKEVNGITIGITGVIPVEKRFVTIDDAFQIIDPATALKALLPELESKSDFIILLSQLRAEQTRALIDELPGIDLGLCIDPIPTDISAPAPSMVMSLLNKGVELGVVTIEKKDSTISVTDAQRIKLDESIPPDTEMTALVEQHLNEIRRIKEEKRRAALHQNELEILKMSPQEFIKVYNNND